MSIWDKLKESIVIGSVAAAPTVAAQSAEYAGADKAPQAKEYTISAQNDKQNAGAEVEYIGEAPAYVPPEFLNKFDEVALGLIEPTMSETAQQLMKEYRENGATAEHIDIDSSINKLQVLNYNDRYQESLQKMSTDKEAAAFVEAYEKNHEYLNKNKIWSQVYPEANVEETLRFSTLDNYVEANPEVKSAMHQTLINGDGGRALNMRYMREKSEGQTEYTQAYEDMLKKMKKKENGWIFKKDRVSPDANRIIWEQYSTQTLDKAFGDNPQMREAAYRELYDNHKAEVAKTMRNNMLSAPTNEQAAATQQQLAVFEATDLLKGQQLQDKWNIVDAKSQGFDPRGKTVDVDAYSSSHLQSFIGGMERFEAQKEQREQARQAKQEKMRNTIAKIRRGHQAEGQEEQSPQQNVQPTRGNANLSDIMAIKRAAKLSGYGD